MSSHNVHVFDQAMSLTGSEGRYTGKASASYWNMVGPFGGVSAASVLQALLQHPDSQGDPVAATFNFAAPIEKGAVNICVMPVKLNRSTQHWLVELSQNGEACLNAIVVLAQRRETFSNVEAVLPDVPSHAELEDMPNAGLPAWAKNYHFRIVKGGFESTFNQIDDYVGQSETITWIEDSPPRPLDFLSLTAICDIFFPRVFIKRQKLMPVGTVSLTVHFHADADEIAEVGARPVLGRAKSSVFHNGFFDQTAEIWSETGKLLATTSQMVYFKD